MLSRFPVFALGFVLGLTILRGFGILSTEALPCDFTGPVLGVPCAGDAFGVWNRIDLFAFCAILPIEAVSV